MATRQGLTSIQKLFETSFKAFALTAEVIGVRYSVRLKPYTEMTSTVKSSLDDDQIFALMKLKRNMKDELQPDHDDRFLLRWLRARSWNAEAAEKMLRASLNSRKQWGVDGDLKSWSPSEPLVSYTPGGLLGFDKEKTPIYVLPLGNVDIVGLLRSVSKQDLIKMTILEIENVLDKSKQTGSYQVDVIFDMENFTLKPYTWRPAFEFVVSLLKMYEANYPEILKVCFVINAPRVFALAFSMVKPFIDEYTISKVKIFKNDANKWQSAMVDALGAENLSKHYGGKMVDPDGDPKCPSKVKPGGKVPKQYYKTNFTNDHLGEKREYVTATIKKGKKLILDFIVAEEGCFLKWDFRTEDHDIKFGVTCVDEDGNVHPVERYSRVSANQLEVSGAIACRAPATYTVTFDNSYSVMRAKKIHYSVYVSEPINKIKINDDDLNGR